MVNINSLSTSSYIKAADLKGQNRTVEIIEEKMETVGAGADAKQKLVIYFKGSQKGLVLNQTNMEIIAEELGSYESADWVGRQITLTTKIAEFNGKRNPAIRVMDKWDRQSNHQPVDAGMYGQDAATTQAPIAQNQQQAQQQPQPAQQQATNWSADLDDEVPF